MLRGQPLQPPGELLGRFWRPLPFPQLDPVSGSGWGQPSLHPTGTQTSLLTGQVLTSRRSLSHQWAWAVQQEPAHSLVDTWNPPCTMSGVPCSSGNTATLPSLAPGCYGVWRGPGAWGTSLKWTKWRAKGGGAYPGAQEGPGPGCEPVSGEGSGRSNRQQVSLMQGPHLCRGSAPLSGRRYAGRTACLGGDVAHGGGRTSARSAGGGGTRWPLVCAPRAGGLAKQDMVVPALSRAPAHTHAGGGRARKRRVRKTYEPREETLRPQSGGCVFISQALRACFT